MMVATTTVDVSSDRGFFATPAPFLVATIVVATVVLPTAKKAATMAVTMVADFWELVFFATELLHATEIVAETVDQQIAEHEVECLDLVSFATELLAPETAVAIAIQDATTVALTVCLAAEQWLAWEIVAECKWADDWDVGKWVAVKAADSVDVAKV